MKALRGFVGGGSAARASEPSTGAKADSSAAADVVEEWERQWRPAKAQRPIRPPASLPMGKRDQDVHREPDAAKQQQNTGFHDPVHMNDRYGSFFSLDRRELSDVSERTEPSQRNLSSRAISDSCDSSARANSPRTNDHLFSSCPISSSSSSADVLKTNSQLNPAPAHSLPASPRQRATSASVLARLPHFSFANRSHDFSTNQVRGVHSTMTQKEKADKVEADFQDRVRKEQEHKRRKAWLEQKNMALRRLKFDPAAAAMELGQLYLQAGGSEGEDSVNLDTAAAWFENSIEMEPSHAEAHYLLARAYDRPSADAVRLDRAAYAYQIAVQIDATNPKYWCSLGVFKTRRQQWSEAMRAFERAISIGEPRTVEVAVAWSNLGQLYEHHWDVLSPNRSESERFEVALQAYLTAFDSAIHGSVLAVSSLARYDRLQQYKVQHFEQVKAAFDADAELKHLENPSSVGLMGSTSPTRGQRTSLSSDGEAMPASSRDPKTPPMQPPTPVVTSASSPSDIAGSASPIVSRSVGLTSAFDNPTPSGMSNRESGKSRRSSSASSRKLRRAGLIRIADMLDKQSLVAREHNERLVGVLQEIRDRLPTISGAVPVGLQGPTTDDTLLEALRMVGNGSSRLVSLMQEHQAVPAGLRALNSLLTSATTPQPMAPARPVSR